MSILTKLKPSDFKSDVPYMGVFGNLETETSARWIVEFLQAREASVPADPWGPFEYGDLDRYYLEKLRKPKLDEHFSFNQLTPGTHVYISSSPDAPVGMDVVQANVGSGFGYRHIVRNEHSIEVESRGSEPGRRGPRDVVRVTDRFVAKLAASPHLFR